MHRDGALPLFFRQPHVGLGFCHHSFMHRFGNRVRIDACGNGHLNFVPEPLAAGGKIEVVWARPFVLPAAAVR